MSGILSGSNVTVTSRKKLMKSLGLFSAEIEESYVAVEASDDEEALEAELKLLDTLPEEIRARFPFYPPLKWEDREELKKLAEDSEAELRNFIRGMKDDYYVEDHIIVEYLRQKLLSKPCQNQGFVLDDPNETTEDPRNPTYDPQISPHHVIYLNASNSLVKHRFKTIMEGQDNSIDEIDNLNEQEGLSLDVEEEIRRRRKESDDAKKRREQLYPGGPQKATFNRILKRISNSPTGDLFRRMKGILDPSNDDETFVRNLAKEMRDADEYSRNLRKESGDVLDENERKIWHEWLKLLKNENDQRHMVRNMPRRNYLLKYFLPKISDCLVNYGLRRPSDPVDFLVRCLVKWKVFNEGNKIDGE
ncbi:unnamed protein product [Rodentolepis nana]|uniref:Uncharacterized protein n=1 Tax=Rodentolepis nana TaxID=102285 RepID=A0A0R3U0H3_RODNA|nr:unnamed protein product [Rodentolepis nana]